MILLAHCLVVDFNNPGGYGNFEKSLKEKKLNYYKFHYNIQRVPPSRGSETTVTGYGGVSALHKSGLCRGFPRPAGVECNVLLWTCLFRQAMKTLQGQIYVQVQGSHIRWWRIRTSS